MLQKMPIMGGKKLPEDYDEEAWDRLEDISELENIGFYEYTEDCVSIVEWADKFPHELPDETLWIYLTRIDDTSRSITLVSDYLTADDLVEIGGPYVVGN